MSSYDNSVSPERKSKTIDHTGFHIPDSYGDNKIVLMVRDPWTIFSYWEINKTVEEDVLAAISNKGLTVQKSILRVFDVTDGKDVSDAEIFSDFDLMNFVESWYVHTGKPNSKWTVQIGILCTNGEFFPLATSNIVETPRYGMSDNLDEQWMCSEELYYKMFAIAGGYGIGTSSMELQELIERHLKNWVSSGGFLSGMFGSASFFMHRAKG